MILRSESPAAPPCSCCTQRDPTDPELSEQPGVLRAALPAGGTSEPHGVSGSCQCRSSQKKVVPRGLPWFVGCFPGCPTSQTTGIGSRKGSSAASAVVVGLFALSLLGSALRLPPGAPPPRWGYRRPPSLEPLSQDLTAGRSASTQQGNAKGESLSYPYTISSSAPNLRR